MSTNTRQTNLPNESANYLARRDELRLAEIEEMRQRERVAELRRQLPEGRPRRITCSRKDLRGSKTATRRHERFA